MTKDDTENPGFSGVKRALLVSLTIVIAIFMLGVVFGFSQSVLERGEITLPMVIAFLALVALLGVSLYLSWKVWPRARPDIEAQSTIKSRSAIFQLLGVGVVLGVVFALAEGGDGGMALVSNAPISPAWASAILLFWLVFVPILTWKWWQSVDEHEATAYREGGFWAAHLYLFLVPTWWLAARAGWMPEQDPMIVFLIISFFWSAWWLYKRYF